MSRRHPIILDRRAAAAAAMLALPLAAGAAVINVPADFSTVALAVGQANSNVGADTILINTAGTYTNAGAISPAADQDLEIRATVAGVVLENTGAGAVIAPTASVGVGSAISVAGVNSANRIELRKAGTAAQPVINSGGGNNRIFLANALLNRTSTAAGSFISYNSTGTSHTALNVSLTGGATGAVNMAVFAPTAAGVTVTLDNVDFSGVASGVSGNFLQVGANLSALNVLNSKLENANAVSVSLMSYATVSAGTYTFTNSSFRSSTTTAAFYTAGGACALNLVRPTFAGALGTIAFSNSTPGASISISGTSAASKVDLNPMLAGGTLRVARMLAGSFSLTDAAANNSSNIYFDSGATLAGNVAITLNRCDFQGGAGTYHADSTGASASTINLTATNTIWTGAASGRTSILGLNAAATAIGASAITLNHCTLMYPPANGSLVNAGVDADNTTGNARADILTGNFSVFEGNNGTANGFGGRATLTGTRNCVNGDITAFLGGQPGDTSFNPITLTATGRVSGNGDPSNFAVGSTETVDIDGNARPAGAQRDSGASEGAFLPVAVSAIAID